MRYFLPLFLTLIICKNGFSQVERIPYYNNLIFNNNLYIIAESDEKSNYYAVNLNTFSSAFEKAYFTELCFSEPKIVRLDSGNDEVAWFKAKKVYSENEVNQVFNNLKTQTISISGSMSEFQKQEWLNRNVK
jgi:hypothetical protein